MKAELPEPWADELGPKGFHSFRDVAAVFDGMSHETVRRLMTGGKTSLATVEKVADKFFDGDRTKVWRMYGVAVDDYGPWELPPGASLLTPEQREAVLAVINVMIPKLSVAGGDGDADADAGGSAPTIRQLKPNEVDLAAYDEDEPKPDED